MPTAGEQLPGGTSELARRLAALEREVKELRAARRAEQTTIGAGGLRVVDGGKVTVDTARGVRMASFGAIEDGRFNHTDGTPQQAIRLRREDGTPTFSCYADIGQDNQAWWLTDREGNRLFADDYSGSGLARPYMPVAMMPSYDAGWDYWPRNSTTTMKMLWRAGIYKQQQRVVVIADAAMDTSGATGYVELRVSGVAQGSPVSVDFTGGFYTLGPFDLSKFAHMSQISIEVYGRRNAGTGSIRASIWSAYTLQSA